jgi:hypothetical protein
MNHLKRLGLAALLGAVAIGLNLLWAYLQVGHSYVVANIAISAGTLINTETMLDTVPIPGDPVLRKRTFFASEDMALLSGRVAPKAYRAGDLILVQDVKQSTPHWKTLGPFRLISVGDDLTIGKKATSASQTVTSVTVAVKSEFDESTRRLLQILDAQENQNSATPDSLLRIIALSVYPSGTAGDVDLVAGAATSAADDRLQLAKDEIAIIVPLINVAGVPGVLLVGGDVGFVVPDYP